MKKNDRYKRDIIFIYDLNQESDEALYIKAIFFFGGLFLIPLIIISLLIEFSQIWFQEMALFIPLITTGIRKRTRKILSAWRRSVAISLVEGVLLLITPSITLYKFEIPWWQEIIKIDIVYAIGILNTLRMGILLIKDKSQSNK